MDRTKKITDRLTSIAKVLCVVACVCCFGIVLGTAGAVDAADAAPVHGWVAQFVFGIAGMAAFGWLAGAIGK